MAPGDPALSAAATPVLAGALLALVAGTACVPASAPEVPEPDPAPAPEAPVSPDAAIEDIGEPAELRAAILAMDTEAEEIREELDRHRVDDEAFRTLSARITELDRRHQARLLEIVRTHGWPTPGQVGGDASHAALVLVLRSGNVELQEAALEALTRAFEQGEIAGEPVAMLTDRIRLARGLPQLYGTQISIEGDHVTVGPIENEAGVDDRRAEMGLMPLEEYLDLVRVMFEVDPR